MKFFTSRKEINNDYLLMKIGDYCKFNLTKQYKEILIDPGVYELTKSPKYSWEDKINIRSFLDGLPDYCYFSADYPCDMNIKYTDLFLLLSWENAIKYCDHPRYIVTVQSKFNDYWSFKEWFNKYNELPIKSGIMGLGNICRIHHLTEYIKHSLDYAFKHCKHQRIHIYGLGMKIIPYAYNLAKRFKIELSIDSNKWTRDPTSSGKPSCNINNMQEYYDTYIQILKNRGVIIS